MLWVHGSSRYRVLNTIWLQPANLMIVAFFFSSYFSHWRCLPISLCKCCWFSWYWQLADVSFCFLFDIKKKSFVVIRWFIGFLRVIFMENRFLALPHREKKKDSLHQELFKYHLGTESLIYKSFDTLILKWYLINQLD